MLKKIWSAVYHVWYYAVIFIATIVLLPFLLATSVSHNTYGNFFFWSRVWGRFVLIGMGQWWKVQSNFKIERNQPYVIIANHTSEIDIMFMYAIINTPFVFIGKKELGRIPLFGYFYKRTNILVDRKSLASKKAVLKQAAFRLDDGVGVCIFPEGGILDASYLLAPFKAGAFKLAIEKQVPIIPITFANNRSNFPDFWEGGHPGMLKATVHEAVSTAGMDENQIDELSDRCYQIIHDELVKYGRTGKTKADVAVKKA